MSNTTTAADYQVSLAAILPVHPTNALIGDFAAWSAASWAVTDTVEATVEREGGDA